MIENKRDYYAGLILLALILKREYLTANTIWGEPFKKSTKKMCKIADIVSREMVKRNRNMMKINTPLLEKRPYLENHFLLILSTVRKEIKGV